MKFCLTILSLLAISTSAFQCPSKKPFSLPVSRLLLSDENSSANESVFVPADAQLDEDEDDLLDKAEMLGKGSAKVREQNLVTFVVNSS